MSVKDEILNTTFDLYHHEAGQSWRVSEYDGTPTTHWDSPDRVLKLREVAFWRQKGGPVTSIDSVKIELPEDGMDLEVVRAHDNAEDLENDFVREYFLRPLREITDELLSIRAVRDVMTSGSTRPVRQQPSLSVAFRIVDKRNVS